MKADTRILSIIVPCYNEEKSVPLFYAETVKQETFFHDKNVEFIDDPFPDTVII